MPITWEELESAREPIRFTVRSAPARLALPDPWSELEASRRVLTQDALRAVGAADD
jgi:DNA primase